MDISVIVQFYNEEENIEFVLSEIVSVLRLLGRKFEIIAVDDGSTDKTSEILRNKRKDIEELIVKAHIKNLGKDACLWAGFEAANGDIVVNTDGDGQDDFNEVPKMLKYLNEYDAVFGQRVDRCDPPLKVVSTKIAFFFRRLILKDNLRDSTCPLKVMKKKTLKYLFPLGGFHRFIPFLLKEAGVPCIGVDVNHRSRHAGRSKYYLLRFFVPAIMDLLFMWWYRKTNLYRQRRDVGHKTGNE